MPRGRVTSTTSLKCKQALLNASRYTLSGCVDVEKLKRELINPDKYCAF